MNLIERLFALRNSPYFAQLRENDLVLIASAARARHYGAGELIGAAQRPLRHLFIVASGSAVGSKGEKLPRGFGAESLLFEIPLKGAIRAGPEGAGCLLIRRAHFHTILHECPGLVLGLLQGERDLFGGRAA